jgi:hypothetical protein
MKECVLHIVAEADKFVGLATVKKLLINNYGFKETGAFKTQLSKCLKALVDENRDDFGKIGGYYCLCICVIINNVLVCQFVSWRS